MGKGFVLTLQAGVLGLALIVAVAAFFIAGAYGLLYLARRAEARIPAQTEGQAAAEDWTPSDPFYAVSGRGRAAYLLLCLEEALSFYGQDLAQWRFLLERFWSVTATAEEELTGWLETVYYLLPDAVLPYETFEDAAADAGYPWSAAQFEQARQCYMSTGYGMIAVNALLQNLYLLASGWDEDPPPGPEGLRLLADTENQLHTFHVPLPQEGPSLTFVQEQKETGPGAPFDGLSLSALPAKPAAEKPDSAAVPVFSATDQP